MKKLLDVKKLTNTKYLNMFDAHYMGDNNDYHYYFASRHNLDKLVVQNNNNNVDAVRILPYLKNNNKIYVVLINEFRHPLNKYIYSTPAGCVEENENPIDCAIREVGEEIGASVINIKQTCPSGFSSAGLTDERIMLFDAEVLLDKSQKLDDIEDINILKIELEEIPNFVNTHEMCLQSSLQLMLFYYKNI